jgi:hypothetical protein
MLTQSLCLVRVGYTRRLGSFEIVVQCKWQGILKYNKLSNL